MRTCSKCQLEKQEHDFYARKHGTGSVCKVCVRARCKVYRLKHLEKYRARSKEYYRAHAAERSAKTKVWATANRNRRRDTQYRLFYGLTLEQFEGLNQEQNGACAICGVVPKGHLYVDHCHITKIVRGLLCSKCNFLIGLAKDSSEVLLNAVRYLEGKNVISS